MKTAAASVSVALIGAGNFARRQHLPNLVRIPEARLAAICDVNLELAEDLCRKYTASAERPARAEADYRRLLEDGDVEMVVIATRADLQPVIAAEALRAGKHVYVEKPLAETPEHCAGVVEAQAASLKGLAVGFNKRFAPIYQKAKEVMQAAGGARHLHFRMTDDAWRWAKGYGPGDLLKLDVCHFFDLARWFTRADIASVYCVGSRVNDETLAVQLTDGTVLSIMFSGNASMDMPKEQLHAICEKGGLTADDYVELSTYGYHEFEPMYRFGGHSHPDGEFMHSFINESLGMSGWKAVRRGIWETREAVLAGQTDDDPYGAERRRVAENNIPNFMRDQGWLASLRSFVTHVRSGEATDHAGAQDALAASRAADAALRSIRTGEVVRLNSGDTPV